jgi:FMN phosphatase YigB (HAD superfamily)
MLSLSNTNAVQWPAVLAGLGAADPFHAHHPSHLSGFHKPDPRAFAAIAQQHAAPSRCYFFDDRAENVDAARRFGWQARRVRGIGETRQACAELGLL